MQSLRLRNTLFFLFAISGFTGLIYESIWSHYLKLFLGHAAYAQALVLAIFMGGMALGAWLASKWIGRWHNLLITYAIIEGVIGLFGLGFHTIFQATLTLSYDSIIPALDSVGAVQLYKWSIATLLILPQSILLGMTFPVMSNGIIRLFPVTPGGTLGMLYFTNSIGAAIGVLISGFVLIARLGLPGTLLIAAIVNILLALVVYMLAGGREQQAVESTAPGPASGIPLLMFSAAFITGAASFIYEIGWIRMLSMVLGASTHSFELMLSAFITGLALGGLWIRRRIDRLPSPFHTAGMIQIIMGLLAIATLVLYNYTFDLMGFLLGALEQNEPGYRLFTLASHLIALLVMLPATFCAGMTLPLFTWILMQSGHGEKSVGQTYASNTLGAIAGVVFTLLVGLPLLGLKGVIILGALLDIILGLIFVHRSGHRQSLRFMLTTSTALVLAAVLFAELDVRKMSSGVYRTGKAAYPNYQYLFHRDGRTATVHVVTQEDGKTAILTNGKSDATIHMQDNQQIAADETTMVLVGAIPLAINPAIKVVANIGMGSGLTAHTLLAWPGIERVDTIEIEPAIIEGARHFRPRVERAYTDPRSRIFIEDAKTYFSTRQQQYDLIISEPSNPWVSGTSSLFTDEFYRHVRQYLGDNGLFVQWIQAYEINVDLVFTILRAISNNFSSYVLYAANDGDLLLIASENQEVQAPRPDLFRNEAMKHDLEQIGIRNIDAIRARYIADHNIINPLLATYRPRMNSDYFPVLDLFAPKARYMREDARELTRLGQTEIPLTSFFSPNFDVQDLGMVHDDQWFTTSGALYNARQLLAYAGNDTPDKSPGHADLELLLRLAEDCASHQKPLLWLDAAYSVAQAVLPYLSSGALGIIWDRVEPACENGLNRQQTEWLGLFRAIGNRDFTNMAEHSSALLYHEHSASLGIEKSRFLFLSLMTALVKMEMHEDALQLWGRNIGSLFAEDSIPLTFMIPYSQAVNALHQQ